MSNMVVALVIRVGEEPFSVAIKPTLASFQAEVGGDLEGFGPTWQAGATAWHGYCDEEGKLKGLPVNEVATRLAHAAGWPMGDALCGTVVFLGPPDSGGGETDVPGGLIAMLEDMAP